MKRKGLKAKKMGELTTDAPAIDERSASDILAALNQQGYFIRQDFLLAYGPSLALFIDILFRQSPLKASLKDLSYVMAWWTAKELRSLINHAVERNVLTVIPGKPNTYIINSLAILNEITASWSGSETPEVTLESDSNESAQMGKLSAQMGKFRPGAREDSQYKSRFLPIKLSTIYSANQEPKYEPVEGSQAERLKAAKERAKDARTLNGNIRKLEALFIEERKVRPDWSQPAKVQKTWRIPLKAILAAADNDIELAERALQLTIAKMIKDNLTFSMPVQVQKTCESIIADLKNKAEKSEFEYITKKESK